MTKQEFFKLVENNIKHNYSLCYGVEHCHKCPIEKGCSRQQSDEFRFRILKEYEIYKAEILLKKLK